MSEYYDQIYVKRLNRYGLDYQSRIQGQRERNFDNYLLKTLYRVEFEYDGKVHAASLERLKQDHTQTQGYLLTKINVDIPNGTVLVVNNQDGSQQPWMIWWLEQIEASGYNRYIVLKMTHELTWTAAGQTFTQLGYFYGPGMGKMQDAVKSNATSALYTENDNLHMFITPYNAALKKEVYFKVVQGETEQAYIVTDVDINSTPGVCYATVDPTLIRDDSAPSTATDMDNPEDIYWLNGGES